MNPKTFSFILIPQNWTNNLNAIRSTLTENSIDIDPTTKSVLDPNEPSTDLTVIEQKQIQLYVNDLINLESNQERTSLVKSSYKIPSPTMLLPNEFPSSVKPTTSTINRIVRSSPSDHHRNLLISNPFYLRNPEELTSNSERFLATSVNSLNLIQTISSAHIQNSDHDQLTSHTSSTQLNLSIKQSNLILPRSFDKSILSNLSRISLSQITNDIPQNPAITSSQDLQTSSNKLIDNISNTSPFEITSQRKNQPEIKHESESLWKTKFTLKTLLAMAHRDEVQALKNRKPIDYHMFLTNKFTQSSLLQYDDHIDRKFTAHNKHSILEQFNEQENRKLYKRLLNTMGLCKPVDRKFTLRKQRKLKNKPSSIISPLPFLINETEKPFLIIYQAVLNPLSNQ